MQTSLPVTDEANVPLDEVPAELAPPDLTPTPDGDAPVAASPIATAILQEMLNTFGGDTATASHIITLFLEDSPPLLDAIVIGLQTRDQTRVAHAAHTLKSSAALVGALALSQKCAALEDICQASTWDMAIAAPTQDFLTTEFERVAIALRHHIETDFVDL